MKVKITKEFKKVVTLDEAPIVRGIVEGEKDSVITEKKAVEMAIHATYDGRVNAITVLKASAEVAKNNRVWNQYGDNTQDFDVWIEGTAMLTLYDYSTRSATLYDMFVIVGAYLSDIHHIDGVNDSELAKHFNIREFREVK